MKKTLLLFIFLQILLSCNGKYHKDSGTEYSQKLEYRLKGDVKEVAYYVREVKDSKIPANTGNYTLKTTMAFDEEGNVMAFDRLCNFNLSMPGAIKEIKIEFSGKGKDLSQITRSYFDDGEAKESRSKFVWSGKYNYTIIPQDKSEYPTVVTLDKNYGVKKSVLKNKEAVEPTEEYETLYKDNKISEIMEKGTRMIHGKVMTYYQIQVMQKFDSFGNPTVIYLYSDVNKKKITDVIYQEYKYY